MAETATKDPLTKLTEDKLAKKATEILTSAIPDADGNRTYEIYFRRGNRKPEQKVFRMKGDLPEAIAEARRHCEVMNYRFCGCYPFIVDLKKQEESRNDELYERSL